MSLRLLLDANLSRRLTRDLSEAGHDVVHVGDVDLLHASDDEIFDWCAPRDRVVVTADTDFPMLLALRRAESPSVVLLRDVADLPPEAHAALLIANLPNVEETLADGAVVSLSPTSVRIRDLPIR